MRTVHKFVVPQPYGDPFSVRMPLGARIVHVAHQGRALCLWAAVEDTRELVDRSFLVTGTGQAVEPWWSVHVGTVLLGDDGRVVVHVWEDPL